ncbi:hypothetical protein ACOMHN_045074 [Nucella lapillus]
MQRAGQAEEGSTRGTSDPPDVHSGDAQPTAPQVRDPKAVPIQGWEQSQRGVREGKIPENKCWSKWPREESGKGKHQKTRAGQSGPERSQGRENTRKQGLVKVAQRGVSEGKTPENKCWSKWSREESGKGKYQKTSAGQSGPERSQGRENTRKQGLVKVAQRGVREGKIPENKCWSKWPREESGKGKHQKTSAGQSGPERSQGRENTRKQVLVKVAQRGVREGKT